MAGSKVESVFGSGRDAGIVRLPCWAFVTTATWVTAPSATVTTRCSPSPLVSLSSQARRRPSIPASVAVSLAMSLLATDCRAQEPGQSAAAVRPTLVASNRLIDLGAPPLVGKSRNFVWLGLPCQVAMSTALADPSVARPMIAPTITSSTVSDVWLFFLSSSSPLNSTTSEMLAVCLLPELVR